MSNPYQPSDLGYESVPTSDGPRSSIAMVFGILNLVFGALGVFGTCAGGLLLAFASQITNQAGGPQIQFLPPDGPLRTMFIVNIALGGVLSIVLIVSGIGLMKYMKWGRSISVVYALVTIVSTVLGTVANLGFSMSNFSAEGLSDQERAAQIGSMVGGGIGGCVGLMYPIILLIFMYNRNLRASLN